MSTSGQLGGTGGADAAAAAVLWLKEETTSKKKPKKKNNIFQYVHSDGSSHGYVYTLNYC